MKKPSPATYLLGNGFSALVILLSGGVVIFQWWKGQVAAPMAVVALIAIVWAINANERLSEYRNWKRAWDAMGGAPAKPRGNGARRAVAVVIWLIFAACVAQLDPHKTNDMLVMLGFAVGSVGLFASAFLRSRGRRPARRGRASEYAPVAILLPVPRKSPDVREIHKGLPAYIGKLV